MIRLDNIPHSTPAKLLIIGLDCAEPTLVFDRFTQWLPTLNRIRETGSWGYLRSTDPPLTIPAWAAMFSGKNAGELGLYGIRNRFDYSYSDLGISAANTVTAPRIWDLAGRSGQDSIVVGVPQTYPVSPVKGCLVAGMLAPDTTSNYTYPAELKDEIERISGGYEIDIPSFRSLTPQQLQDRIVIMTQKRFRVFRHFLKTRSWTLGMCVEIGLDRLHHGFWHFWDATHPLYFPGNMHVDVLPDYYRLLDEEINQTLQIVPEDTAVFIVSDHGAQPMLGGIRINQWLINNGYLKLKHTPPPDTELKREWIDWKNTRAWGEGGYYARIFLNIKDREPCGITPPSHVDGLINRLSSELRQMNGPDGKNLGNRVINPQNHFKAPQGIPPDLMVYLGNLAWRSISDVGSSTLFTRQNNRGPDGANHALNGIYLTNLTNITVDSPGKLEITALMPLFSQLLKLDGTLM
jgi:predicted AlkP superfamily phosphohydrolase/phosphomutase